MGHVPTWWVCLLLYKSALFYLHQVAARSNDDDGCFPDQ